MSYIWQVSKAKGGFKLRVIAKNGKCVATFGETYKNKAHAMRMADKLSKESAMQLVRNDIEQSLISDTPEEVRMYMDFAMAELEAKTDKVEGVK